jgi:hypothetical protein
MAIGKTAACVDQALGLVGGTPVTKPGRNRSALACE